MLYIVLLKPYSLRLKWTVHELVRQHLGQVGIFLPISGSLHVTYILDNAQTIENHFAQVTFLI